MPIRDIFLPLLSYPESPSSEAIDAVVDLVENLSKKGADAEPHKQVRTRVYAVVLEAEIDSGLYFESAYIGEFLEEQQKKVGANTQRLIDDFTKATAHRAVLSQWRVERRNPFETQNLLVEEARLHHLTALPVLKDNDNHQYIVERLIFESGRPVLIFPDRPPRQISKNFTKVAVAWDGSRQAARAVADAMPFLRRASHVRIFSVMGDKPMTGASRGGEIAAALVSEGIDATFEEVAKGNPSDIAIFFENYIADRGCDLLVMGAYGHTRLREFILGGATQSILANPPTWVMLSH